MSLTLCVQLWAVPGNEGLLATYEDEVLSLLGDHGARLLQRVRSVERGDGPYEVQIIELPDEAALEAYLADPRRLAAAPLRDRSVARTQITRVTQI
ncbi:hypothetical protein ASC61_04570 [Aeromicrobium sp. Root344]|uniref:hypothetical protein n=1 Tax=Aeromicrobium sp. Root344 TaxID=1736521 RepID=UPI0006FF42E9|nr:hypothetical protein [Aeromicrobium sp. Root344]KQV77047.1 hypothetical protein ASC61_04570 [Aeromicrobium sp. Root344]